jgi:selenocysteine lyase/cysteine desulfurase
MPWCQKRDSMGIEIDVVPHRDGQLVVDDIAARIGPRTAAVALSSVQWTNGFRCDLDEIGSLCREHGVWLIVDAIQQLGAMPLDVGQTPVDVLACGGHKWLNAPFGAGFLYIREGAMERLRPPLAGYLSLETPADGWGTYFATPSMAPVRDYRFEASARRYEIGGTANYPGTIGLAASLRLINDLGPQAISAHIMDLTDHLLEGLRSLNVDIVTPVEPKHRSGIVSFSVGNADANLALMEHLLDEGVLVSVRYTSEVGGVRVSSHFFNSIADIERLLGGIRHWLHRRG